MCVCVCVCACVLRDESPWDGEHSVVVSLTMNVFSFQVSVRPRWIDFIISALSLCLFRVFMYAPVSVCDSADRVAYSDGHWRQTAKRACSRSISSTGSRRSQRCLHDSAMTPRLVPWLVRPESYSVRAGSVLGDVSAADHRLTAAGFRSW